MASITVPEITSSLISSNANLDFLHAGAYRHAPKVIIKNNYFQDQFKDFLI